MNRMNPTPDPDDVIVVEIITTTIRAYAVRGVRTYKEAKNRLMPQIKSALDLAFGTIAEHTDFEDVTNPEANETGGAFIHSYQRAILQQDEDA